MDRKTPSVSDVVRRAVELADPDDVDPTLGRLERQLEDDDEPVTAVENLEERLAIALEGADYDGENPAVAVAGAVVLYLAAHPGELDADREPQGVVERAVRAQWRGDTPAFVDDWLAGR
jgi:hypothetical protein